MEQWQELERRVGDTEKLRGVYYASKGCRCQKECPMLQVAKGVPYASSGRKGASSFRWQKGCLM